jgi:undecaprenyl-diphosphatase
VSTPTLLPEPAGAELRLTMALNRLGVYRPVLHLFRAVSRLGDGAIWYVLMAVLAVLGGSYGFKAAAHMGLTALFVAALYRGMKRLIRRPRPYRRHAGIIARIRPLDEFSFPSGHTLHATCFTLIGMGYYPQLGWLLVPFSLLVAASRVILGVHYPSDVLAAAAIGTVIALTSLALF